MNLLALDIETMPNLDMLDKLPEVKPDSKLKDEDKIAADIEAKQQEQIEKMALSPMYGKIACIGLYGENLQTVLLDDEKAMLDKLFRLIKNTPIVTWNGKNFDFDFIFKRAVYHGIKSLKEMKFYTDKYKANLHNDLMQEFCQFGKYEKLDDVANVFLDMKKIDFDVKQIPELLKTEKGQEELKAYCLRDCEITYKLAKRFGY